jgi:hypothetical protein
MPLAMEGIFSFFLESAFLGLFLFGEKRLSRRFHWLSAVLVFTGSWISGFFIIVTNAWMQHPVGYKLLPNGVYEVASFTQLLLNPWAWLEYAPYFFPQSERMATTSLSLAPSLAHTRCVSASPGGSSACAWRCCTSESSTGCSVAKSPPTPKATGISRAIQRLPPPSATSNEMSACVY